VADSGANISCTNTQTAQKHGLAIRKWSQPFPITFANNTKTTCTEYANFGPVIGKVAIVPNAPDTLLSVAALTERGFEVRFSPHGQGVGLYHNDQLIFRGTQDPTTKLFHLDLQILINLPPLPTHAHTISSLQKPRNTRITAQTIRDVLWLHKRMGHASRQQMATAIQSAAWIRVPPTISPTNINAVLTRLDCTACSLCKRNRHPTGTGSSVHGFPPS